MLLFGMLIDGLSNTILILVRHTVSVVFRVLGLEKPKYPQQRAHKPCLQKTAQLRV